MVTVDKLKIHSFGRFRDREFSLSPGLNVVYGGNEAGKSTIHCFIEAMLYGFWQPNSLKKELEPGFEKCRPWAGSAYGGEMEYTWPQGTVRVVRDFTEGTVSLYDLASSQVIQGLPLNSWGEPDIGRLHFGCSKLVFRNTISISQLGSATDSAVAQEVRSLLSNLAQSGGSGISVKQGLEALVSARRYLEPELAKARDLLAQAQEHLAAAREQTRGAAQLEIQQYGIGRQVEELTEKRRHLKDMNLKKKGQVATAKLALLDQLRTSHQAVVTKIQGLGEGFLAAEAYQDWQEAQARLEQHKGTYARQRLEYEELQQQSQSLQEKMRELAPYAEYNQDTLIEMSSAWQIQAKGRLVIEEMQEELAKLGEEIRGVTAELAKLPYFRPDALEQAAALQSLASGEGTQVSPQLEKEIDQQMRAVNSSKTLRWVLLFSLPAVAAASVFYEHLLALLAVPLLIGLFACSKSIKKANNRSRSLRRELYTLELDYVNSQRAREHAQRELSAFLARLGATDLQDMKNKYLAFISLSERNYNLLREQKFVSGKLEDYDRETEAKARELHTLLQGVGLGDLPMDEALASFRVNLDQMLEIRLASENCRDQEAAALRRLQETQQELELAEGRQAQLLHDFKVGKAEEIEGLAARTALRRELEAEAAGLKQRLEDLLAGITEEDLQRRATEAESLLEVEGDPAPPEKIELLEEEILELQGQRSELLGRLEGIYATLPAPAELQEAVWRQEERCRWLAGKLQAADLAFKTVNQLAEEQKSQIAPELNDMVSAVVGRITGGKYDNLRVAQDMSISVASPESPGEVSLEKLSGGTVDQFYFACRVAIADLVTGGGLPLFLDDSFVQYDDQRLQHMLDLLMELGRSRQIILFTCQQREKDKLSQIAPGNYRWLDLEN